ncbi:Nicotinamidase-related amidase [Pseudoxanthobacter soli DSM 19599]|uniref:Nicotinamidase-related amidase n=2 Tax=Pseudoxanthobacter TaxID=433838 RepID=A0A1M7ZPL9_9HYPH|nr:Nicotinamidase-related amidase [Pseudoxanthobacter soli DSM 19599]
MLVGCPSESGENAAPGGCRGGERRRLLLPSVPPPARAGSVWQRVSGAAEGMSRKQNRLKFGALDGGCAHVCVDMQRMFAEETDWKTPWMSRVLPNVTAVAAHRPADTVFTRFIPPRHAEDARGTWRRYYERWSSMTLEHLDPTMVGLVEPLAALVPPAAVVDKSVYSPWMTGTLHHRLRRMEATTVIITGCETDVCVLATVLGAVDRGYRVVIVTDALCSSSDETHDALMTLYDRRYGAQVEAVTTDIILDVWN